jgi:hypothetical protein
VRSSNFTQAHVKLVLTEVELELTKRLMGGTNMQPPTCKTYPTLVALPHAIEFRPRHPTRFSLPALPLPDLYPRPTLLSQTRLSLFLLFAVGPSPRQNLADSRTLVHTRSSLFMASTLMKGSSVYSPQPDIFKHLAGSFGSSPKTISPIGIRDVAGARLATYVDIKPSAAHVEMPRLAEVE